MSDHKNSNERMAELYTEAAAGFKHEWFMYSVNEWEPCTSKEFSVLAKYRKIEKPLELWIARDEDGATNIFRSLPSPQLDRKYFSIEGRGIAVYPNQWPCVEPGSRIKFVQVAE